MLMGFFKYQPQVLVIGYIIIQPVEENKEPVFDSQYQHQVQAHPDQPGKKAFKMQFRFGKIYHCKIAAYCGQGAFIEIFKLF